MTVAFGFHMSSHVNLDLRRHVNVQGIWPVVGEALAEVGVWWGAWRATMDELSHRDRLLLEELTMMP
jgi:hypothetical protein